MRSRDRSESGYMYGFILLMSVIILISLASFTLLIHPSYYSGEAAYTSLKVLTDDLALSGHVTGYAGGSATPAYPPVLQPPSGPPGLSAVRLDIRLASLRTTWASGTGDDLSSATVVLATPAGSEVLPMRTAPSLARPGWSIIRKGGMLPGTSANANNILEPNEVFSILVFPSGNLLPGTPFAITMSIPNVRPLTVNRTVPRPITPVMDLG